MFDLSHRDLTANVVALNFDALSLHIERELPQHLQLKLWMQVKEEV